MLLYCRHSVLPNRIFVGFFHIKVFLSKKIFYIAYRYAIYSTINPEILKKQILWRARLRICDVEMRWIFITVPSNPTYRDRVHPHPMLN